MLTENKNERPHSSNSIENATSSSGTSPLASYKEVPPTPRGYRTDYREIKIHVYRKRQTSDSSWEFLKTENKQIKTVPNDSYG